jgi:hypothetical protein
MFDLRRSWKQTAGIVLADLHMFLSLCIARYIVWRTLAARRRASGKEI